MEHGAKQANFRAIISETHNIPEVQEMNKSIQYSQDISNEYADERTAVSYIQSCLYQLSFSNPDIPPVVIDGIWDEQTEMSLRAFQKKYGLPVTGVADLATWELLRDVTNISQSLHSPTRPILVFPRYPEGYVWDSQSSPAHIGILQYVLRELSTEYFFDGLQLSGVYDSATRNAVLSFQKKNGLTQSGTVDRTTWNTIAEQYNIIADISNR